VPRKLLALANEVIELFLTAKRVLLHLLRSPLGTELPIPNVRSSVANGGKADKISQCEFFAF
jgi:hypothetical protein